MFSSLCQMYRRFRSRFNLCIRQYAWFLALMVMFNLTYAARFYWMRDADILKENMMALGQQLCLSWLLLLVVVWLLTRLSWHGLGRLLLRGWLLFSGLYFFVDVWMLFSYRSLLDKAMLQISLATNSREMLEFLRLRTGDLLSAAGVLLLAIVLGWLLRMAVCRCLQPSSNAAIIFFVFLCFGSGWGLYEKPSNIEYCLSIERASDMVYCLYGEMKSYEDIAAGLASYQVQLTHNESRIPYVVFILGESTSRHHMGVYGYPLATTPELGAREADGSLLVFQDVVSPHTYTMAVLRELFTFYHKAYGGEWYEYGNYFDILRAAGYHTAWISNQESSGLYGNAGRAYADRCDEKAFTLIRDSENDVSRYDEAVLPLLDASLEKNRAKKSFYTIHLMGTHEDYIRRYPPEYDVFTAADEAGDKQEWRKMRAEYDNAVRYNDFIVNEIIKRFENKNAIVIYISDHGEEVYDRWDFRGHAEHGSFYQLEIPMLIWTSDVFRRSYPELVRNMTDAVDQPFMTNDMIYLLMDMMEIGTSEYDPSRSPLNPAFDAEIARIYEGSTYRRMK